MIRDPELTLQVTGLTLWGRWYPGETEENGLHLLSLPPRPAHSQLAPTGQLWRLGWTVVSCTCVPWASLPEGAVRVDVGIWSCPLSDLRRAFLPCPHPAGSDLQVEEMEVKQLWCPPLPNVCSNTDLDGWPHSGAGVLRAAGETQGLVCGPRGGWLCWGRAAQEWRPQGPGSCRRGPHPGHKDCSAGRRARGRTHSLGGSGPRPPALLQSGPRCTAGHRPLSGRRERGRWTQPLAHCPRGGSMPGLVPSESSWQCSSPHLTPPPAPRYHQTTGPEDRATTLLALLLSKPLLPR